MDLCYACGGGGDGDGVVVVVMVMVMVVVVVVRGGSKNFMSVECPAHAPRVYGDVIFVTD